MPWATFLKMKIQRAMKILPQISRLHHARSATSYSICSQQASEEAHCIVQSLPRDWRHLRQTVLSGDRTHNLVLYKWSLHLDPNFYREQGVPPQFISPMAQHNVRWQHLSRIKDVLLLFIKLTLSCENAAVYYPGPVTLSSTDGAPITTWVQNIKRRWTDISPRFLSQAVFDYLKFYW